MTQKSINLILIILAVVAFGIVIKVTRYKAIGGGRVLDRWTGTIEEPDDWRWLLPYATKK